MEGLEKNRVVKEFLKHRPRDCVKTVLEERGTGREMEDYQIASQVYSYTLRLGELFALSDKIRADERKKVLGEAEETWKNMDWVLDSQAEIDLEATFKLLIKKLRRG